MFKFIDHCVKVKSKKYNRYFWLYVGPIPPDAHRKAWEREFVEVRPGVLSAVGPNSVYKVAYNTCWVGRVAPEDNEYWALDMAHNWPEDSYEVIGEDTGEHMPHKAAAKRKPKTTWLTRSHYPEMLKEMLSEAGVSFKEHPGQIGIEPEDLDAFYAVLKQCRALAYQAQLERAKINKARKIREKGLYVVDNGGRILKIRLPESKKDRKAGKIEAYWHTKVHRRVLIDKSGYGDYSAGKGDRYSVKKWVTLDIDQLCEADQEQAKALYAALENEAS